MTAFTKIVEWVEKKPIILGRFGKALSESLINSARGFEYFTIAKPHSTLQGFKVPTLCLLEIQSYNATKCYLATATWKNAISTFDSRLTIKKLRPIALSSFQDIEREVTNTRLKHYLRDRVPIDDEFSMLSPKLSAHIVQLLSRDHDNHHALDTALALLPELRLPPNNIWAQEDAIHLAMATFGIRNQSAKEVILKSGATSGLRMVGTHLYEDNVVRSDASQLLGFDAIASEVTGRTVFERGAERLIIYTANRLPLEEMLGVDLIYINETKGNIIMVQYKMLEEVRRKDGGSDWIFRPNNQYEKEVARMQIPASQGALKDYRLNSSPFFFKFVMRKLFDTSPTSFLVSLEHLEQVLVSLEAQGPRGGIRMSYDALDGTYLRQGDFISLIRSGYVGTHRAQTWALAKIIDEVSRGDRALVLAWQRLLDPTVANRYFAPSTPQRGSLFLEE